MGLSGINQNINPFVSYTCFFFTPRCLVALISFSGRFLRTLTSAQVSDVASLYPHTTSSPVSRP